MQVDITGQHMDITDALRDHVNSKLEKVTRHFDQVINVHVVLNVEKLRHMAEATVSISGGQLFANAEDDDMYAAIDSLFDKLDRQAIKHKEKTKDHRS